MRDSHACSSRNFSLLKFLLVAFLGLVVGGGDLGRSNSPLLSVDQLSPCEPGGAGVVLVVSSSG